MARLFKTFNYSVAHWRRKVFNIGGWWQTLVLTDYWWGHTGPHTIFKIIGGLPGPYSPTPLLLRLCYMYLYALKSVLKGGPFRDSLYTVLIAQSLLHNTTLYLHVPSSCGHHIFSISDILFIKKYPEMGCRYYRIVSSRKGLLYRCGQSMS